MSLGKLWVLLLNAFVDMLGYAMVFPLLPFYAVRLDASATVIGFMVASFSVAQVAASPLWGRFSDRFGRRPALLVSLGGSCLAFLVFAFADSIGMLFLSRIVQGASGGTTGVMQAYVGDSVPPRERAKALGWLSAATNLGVMIGPAVGSAVWLLGSRTPGLLAASLCLVNLVFAWRLLPESKAETKADAEARKGRRSISAMVWETLRHPGRETAELIWIYAVAMTAFSSMTAVLALYLMRRFGIDEASIGYIFPFLGAVSVVMRAGILGRLVSRFGEVRLMRAGALLLGLGLVALPLPSQLAALLPVMVLVPIGTALLFPATSALLSQRCDRRELG
ncbi:MAG: MFS transporter, partial [Vicinamibacteria bacterium]